MTTSIIQNKKDFWKSILGEIQLKVSPMIYKTQLARTGVEDILEDKIIIYCEDDFIKNNVDKKHKKIIEETIEKVTKKKFQIQTIIKRHELLEKDPKSKSSTDDLGPLFKPQRDPNEIVEEKQRRSNLSSKFTFENFIMGRNNNLAYAIASAVSDKPGELYNPVFLYSGVGLGKTHLLQAIGNKIIKNKPGAKVIYTTGEAFTNELIEAIQSGRGKGGYSTNEFRNKFRKADVFLIDDVQFVIGRASTQEEFFHTFNALYMDQKQIVITSDRPPKDFINLEERITSRFSSGIIADIQPPDMEMRVAILRTKRDDSGDVFPNEVIDFISEKIDTNIRELVGAYNQVLTFGKATGENIDVNLAARALGQSIREKNVKSINVSEIINAVCTYYSIKSSELKGKKRNREIVLPRQVAMYLLKEITEAPLMTIGDLLGGRDHTTIMHGVDKIQKEIKESPRVKQDIINVKQIIYTE